MKNTYFLLLSIISVSTIVVTMDSPKIIHAKAGKLFGDLQKGPMNPDWFYAPISPYNEANNFHEQNKWREAAQTYKNIKNQILIQHIEHNNAQSIVYQPTHDEIAYAKHMCNLNEAICFMAQRLPHPGWESFDHLINIPVEKRVSKEMIHTGVLRDALVKIRTDKIGIGDIFHLMYAAYRLKDSTGCHIVFSVRDFLKNALSGFAMACGLTLIGESETQLPTDYEIHLVSLLGLLELRPDEIVPPRVLVTAPERAMVAVAQQINPLLALGKTILTGFLGENRPATLMGGKILKRRDLDSEPFKALLRKHPHVMLLDAGTKDSRIAIDENQKNQYMQLVAEEQAFDTLLALSAFVNIHLNMFALGADNGPTNVFARGLSPQAQKRMAFIIPNGSKNAGEYDMRLEGEGNRSKHMFYDNCMVYKCENRAQQTEVIAIAYDDMVKMGLSLNN